MMKQRLLVAFLTFLPISSVWASWAMVHVFGTVTCNGKPYVNQSIGLFEKNFATFDTLIQEVVTDENGNYNIKNSAGEWLGTPKFYVYIANFCNPSYDAPFMHCGQHVKKYIPDWATRVWENRLTIEPYNVSMEMSTVTSDFYGLETVIFGPGIIHPETCQNKPGVQKRKSGYASQ